jgi:hypothetical protein
LYYEARVHTQEPAEHLTITFNHLCGWSDALFLTPWHHDLNGNSPHLHMTFFSQTIKIFANGLKKC